MQPQLFFPCSAAEERRKVTKTQLCRRARPGEAASAPIPSNYQPNARCSDAMPMSGKINLWQVQGPRRAGTQRLAAQPCARRGRSSAGRPLRFLPPGIVPPGSPGRMPATCYF